MADLDFDELDRAVNSLISKTPTAPAAKPAAQPSAPQISPVTPPAAPVRPASPITANQPATQNNSPAAAQSLAGQRSSGRFMDVIHPSTDMRPTTTSTQNTVSTPVGPISSPVTPQQITEPTPKAPEIAYQPVTLPDSQFVDQKALETPFISGAKVDKRPLGAFSAESSDMAVEITPSGEVVEQKPSPVADQQPTSADSGTPLPEELRGDLLKIESGSSGDIAVPEQDSEKEPDKLVAPEFEKEPTGPTSIVQQYKEQKPKTDEKPGAIYDTSVYHKPLAPDGKKKSNLLWIVWIILLIIFGVGAGAIAYFYILPLIVNQ